ncbi:hypothetical protein [Streptomyces stelliscabiei]|uniref:hypothetical protein n=1 Tax=Streptomyces stelliscabiei TaxID=146820 RepID=UPI002FF08A0C
MNTPIYHAEASANFSTQNTVNKSSETTHKRSRTQSANVTSEMKRNFKTTFKTVTETTDTSSRRYVVQNTTLELVNYELRRKMRKVGVQMQHIGTRLCWQVYLPREDLHLGMGTWFTRWKPLISPRSKSRCPQKNFSPRRRSLPVRSLCSNTWHGRSS